MRLFFIALFCAGLSWIAYAVFRGGANDDATSGGRRPSKINSPEVDASLSDGQSASGQDSAQVDVALPGLTFAPGQKYPHSAKTSPTGELLAPETAAVLTPPATVPPAPAASPLPRPSPTIGLLPLSPQEPGGAIISSLQDLQNPLDESGRINPGVRSNTGGALVATPTVTPTPDNQAPWVTGQTTGYAMLAMMHPRARAMADRQVEALVRARIRQTFIAVLADGTFDYDAEVVTSAARKLSADGRTFTLLMYLASGPTMRRFDTTPISAGFARFDPESFRSSIRFDLSVRSQYATIASRAHALAKEVKSIKAENSVLVAPSLEDNLDRESYRAIRELTRAEFGEDATIIRNICPGCWPGNDTDSLGDPIEGHTEDLLARLGPSDVFTLDGLGHRYSGEFDQDQLAEDRIKQLKELAIQREVGYFGLWRKQRQGLGSQRIHPDERTYEIPTNEQLDADVALLRYGLELE